MKTTKKILITIILATLVFVGAVVAYYVYDAHFRLRDEPIAQEVVETPYDAADEPASIITETPAVEDDYADCDYYDDYEEPVDLTPFLDLIAAFNDAREQTGNDDIVAYISIPDTNVNYPVVQAGDNIFYLHHDIRRVNSAAGAIFLDYLNSPDFTDPNTIIYGHNMRGGIKFNNLRNYVFGDRTQSFLQEHPHIIIITEYEVLIYEIFSVFTTHIEFEYIQVDFVDDEFAELVDEIIRRSYHDTGVTATDEDNVLILSTCTNIDRDTRIVVASRLMERLLIW